MTQQLINTLEGWLGRNGRQRNRRVVTVENMRQLRRWLVWVTDCWEVSSRVYMGEEERKKLAEELGTKWPPVTRPRLREEFPENDPEAWRKLERTMTAIANKADEIRLWAGEQERLTRERLARDAAA